MLSGVHGEGMRFAVAQSLTHRGNLVPLGARLPSQTLLEALFKEWQIKPKEQLRIKLKVEIEKRKRKGLSHISLLEDLNRLSPEKNYKKIELNQY